MLAPHYVADHYQTSWLIDSDQPTVQQLQHLYRSHTAVAGGSVRPLVCAASVFTCLAAGFFLTVVITLTILWKTRAALAPALHWVLHLPLQLRKRFWKRQVGLASSFSSFKRWAMRLACMLQSHLGVATPLLL